jgi:Predicted phosphotransferase related to Ser/Thr protein kinases
LRIFYKKTNLDIDFAEFKKQFDFMGVQRHLKILGIFKRLSIRDGKHQYLENIPLVVKYVLNMADKYPEISNLKDILCLA